METEALRVIQHLDHFVHHDLGLRQRTAHHDARCPAGVDTDSDRTIHGTSVDANGRRGQARRTSGRCGMFPRRAGLRPDTSLEYWLPSVAERPKPKPAMTPTPPKLRRP